MIKILRHSILTEELHLFELEAPRIARKAEPGQFVIVRSHEDAERIPLTIADFDREKGSITIIVQVVGAGTRRMAELDTGGHFAGVAGPLGHPTPIENRGTVVCVGGGVGIACVYPIARGFLQAGNRVLSIIGARTEELLIYREEMQAASTELHIATDDGSVGRKGFVTDILAELIEREEKISFVFAVGPTIMMRAVAECTRPAAIETWVSLNPVMVDGTGMCGGCRVTVGNEDKYACVDGPDFNAHLVDFDRLMQRQRSYHEHEEACRMTAQVKGRI